MTPKPIETPEETPKESQVPPQLQQQVDMFTANAMHIVHNKKTSDGLIKKITNSENPVMEIADATLEITERLESGAEGRGMATTLQVFASGASAIMGEIIDLAEMAGLEKLTDEQKQQTFGIIISKYLDNSVKSGKMSKEELVSMGQQAAQSPAGKNFRDATKNMQQPEPTGGVLETNQPTNTGGVL